MILSFLVRGGGTIRYVQEETMREPMVQTGALWLQVLDLPQHECTDKDEDCLLMTREQVLCCMLHSPENGYCPYAD